ncbi:MAG TPA: TIM-barrel domain-containing protein, partial [Gemmatimonadales bacterium]|nr:TIM-barrel domain-containing protein [Gemmatimonadales bacterium]
IPADVIYLDIHYMDGYRVFTWDRDRFPDPAGMLRELHTLGFKVVTIIDPGVKADTAYGVAREGVASGHFVRYPDGALYVGSVWPGPAYFPDFSRAATRRWWGDKLRVMATTGVDGFWNDMNEPAVWGKAFPVEIQMDDHGRGSSFKRMHNLYGLLMAKATYEALREGRPEARPFVLTRAGFAGTQRFSAVWTGDNVPSWEHLELGIRMMLGLGLSGMPFVGTDVGGFAGAPSPELFARWIQVGAFSPLFRTHAAAGTPRREPWSFGEEIEAVSRSAITLRYRLLPYFYTLFHEAHTSGAPILRPLFWHYPADSNAYDRRYQHEFLVGADLLVVPVTRDGQRLKEVYFPAGRWLDLHTERVYEGPSTTVVPAPLEQIPMFLREGAILPSQEPMQYVGEQDGGTLTLDVFPGTAPCAQTLYEDDGETFGYETGGFRETHFTCGQQSGTTWVEREVTHAGFPARSPARMLEVRIHESGRVKSVRVQESGSRQRIVVK